MNNWAGFRASLPKSPKKVPIKSIKSPLGKDFSARVQTLWSVFWNIAKSVQKCYLCHQRAPRLHAITFSAFFSPNSWRYAAQWLVLLAPTWRRMKKWELRLDQFHMRQLGGSRGAMLPPIIAFTNGFKKKIG